MPRYIIQRTFQDGLTIPTNQDGAIACSLVVERNADHGVTWIHSYVSEDHKKLFVGQNLIVIVAGDFERVEGRAHGRDGGSAEEAAATEPRRRRSGVLSTCDDLWRQGCQRVTGHSP